MHTWWLGPFLASAVILVGFICVFLAYGLVDCAVGQNTCGAVDTRGLSVLLWTNQKICGRLWSNIPWFTSSNALARSQNIHATWILVFKTLSISCLSIVSLVGRFPTLTGKLFINQNYVQFKWCIASQHITFSIILENRNNIESELCFEMCN
jgi:hypothetical protein